MEPLDVNSIKHLDQEQAEVIADKFSKVSQEYEPLQKDDIEVPFFDEKSIPSFLHLMLRNI